jgi:hypothetical protein
MEAIVITLWFIELTQVQNSFFSVFLLIFSVSVIVFSSQRFFQKIRVKKTIRVAIFLIMVIVLLGITIKINLFHDVPVSIFDLFIQPFLTLAFSLDVITPIIHHIFFLLIMARAMWLSVQVIDSNTVLNSLKVGIVLFIVYGLLIQNDIIWINALVFLVYLLTALFTLSSSRVTHLAYSKGGQLPSFSRNWLFTLFFASFFILGIGFIGGWFLGTQVSNLIIILFFIIIGIILVVGMIIAAPFIFIINQIINYFSQFITSNQAPQEQQVQVLVNPLTEAVLDNIDNLETLVNAPGYGKIIFITAVIVILLIFMFRFLFGNPWTNPNLENSYESTHMKKEKTRIPKLNMAAPLFSYKKFQKWMIKNRVRKLYFSFLEKCDQLSLPRKNAETPIEFQHRLQLEIPQFTDEIQTITAIYNQIRYGLYPESEKELQAADAAWSRFKNIKIDVPSEKNLNS